MSYQEIVQRVLPDVVFHQNRYALKLAELVAQGCRWLDIGSGTRLHDGYGVPTSAELASRARLITGADFVIDHLKQNTFLNSAIGASAELLPFRTGAFDIVTANMVLEHLPNPGMVFGEVARALAPGGRFIFITPNKSHPAIRAASILLPPRVQRMLAHRIEGRSLEHIFLTFYRANTLPTIRALAQSAGLAVRELEVFRGIPFVRKPLAVTYVEALFIKTTGWKPLRGLGSNILGVLEKPASAQALPSRAA